jgi:hypothetical protein
MSCKKNEPARMDIKDLLPIGLVIMVTGIALSFGAQVQGEIRDDQGITACADRSDSFTSYNSTSNLCYNSSGSTSPVTNSYGVNISDKGLEASWNVSKKMPTIGTIAGIVIIIGLLLSGFAYLMSRR